MSRRWGSKLNNLVYAPHARLCIDQVIKAKQFVGHISLNLSHRIWPANDAITYPFDFELGSHYRAPSSGVSSHSVQPFHTQLEVVMRTTPTCA